MAGRYVVLEFDDKDAAQAFLMNEHVPKQMGFRRIAVYLKPTAFCRCPDKARQDNRNWVKNRKYGLSVCIRCRRPSVFHERGVIQRLQFVFGYNLLEAEDE